MGTGLSVGKGSVGTVSYLQCAACQAHTWTEERR